MNTIKTSILWALLALLMSFHVVSSQVIDSTPTDNIIGEKFTLKSQILADNRDIQIYLPESYQGASDKYPVLYILDGQRLHTLGVSILQSFRSTVKMTPEFIIVSINNKYPDRFSHFQKADFLAFIEQELITHVDKNYRTTEERILFAWEFAGAYAIQSLIDRPGLFSSHIAASPYPLAETWFAEQSRVEQLESKLTGEHNSKLKGHLYFTVSPGEGVVVDGTEKLATLLTEKANDSLRWTYRVIAGEQHLSTPFATLFQGLIDYFYGYKEFQIDGLEQFQQAGGLKNFYAYNKIRAERFGFSETPLPWSMFTIVRNAMRADNFEQFDLFVKEFYASDMIAKISLRNSNSIAQFYVKYKHYQQAIDIYKKMAEVNLENARIQNELGDLYLMLNNKALAKKYYQRAVELAEKSKDDKLEEYQKDLNSL